MDEVVRRLAAGVGDRNLDVDVRPPRRDLPRLPLHFVEFVGEDLERDGPVGDRFEDLAREAAVVADARLAHEGRVGGEAFDERLAVHLQHAGFVRPVGKQLHLQIIDLRHSPSGPFP